MIGIKFFLPHLPGKVITVGGDCKAKFFRQIKSGTIQGYRNFFIVDLSHCNKTNVLHPLYFGLIYSSDLMRVI